VSRPVRAGCAVLGGLLLAAAQPDLSWWPLAWIGFVPMLLAVRGERPRAAFALGWLGGLGFTVPVLYWIAPTIANFTRIEMPVATLVLLLLCATVAVTFGLFAAIVEWLALGGISRVLSAPIVWTVIEWSRTFLPAGFPWALQGYSQHELLPLIQVADVTGVWGISALLMFANAGLVELVRDGLARHRLLLASIVVAVVGTLAYGKVRMDALDAAASDGDVVVGIVQGNVAQDQKWNAGMADRIFASYAELSSRAADQGAKLVVWPEAAVPFFLEIDQRTEDLYRLADRLGVYLLVGAPGVEYRRALPPRQYNRAWMVVPGRGLEGPYDKMQLVPFGEYVPFGWLLGWVDKAVEGVGDFGRGTRYVVFEGPPRADGDSEAPVRVGCLICYEGIFPDLSRRFVAAGAELLVNISNDAWYGRTSAPHQHLAMAAVRAVETRVPLVRATNTGISAYVDPVGRVRGTTALFEQTSEVETVRLIPATSVYRVLGDWFVYACLAALAALVAARLRLGPVLIRSSSRGILARP